MLEEQPFSTSQPGRQLTSSKDRLDNHLLVQVRPHDADKAMDLVSQEASGIWISGNSALSKARELRKSTYSGIVIADHETYRSEVAEPGAVFSVPQNVLFGGSLADVLKHQVEAGASVAVTPTRYIRLSDSESLKEVVTESNKVSHQDSILLIPASASWLNKVFFNQFKAILKTSERPVALILGGDFDPLQGVKEASNNLRILASEVPNFMLARADLAAIDAMCHGAFAGSIGYSGALRHLTPAGEPDKSSGGVNLPSVLLSDLLTFKRGDTIAKLFANYPPPICQCLACNGLPLDRFIHASMRGAAAEHNIQIWSLVAEEVNQFADLPDRKNWWLQRCRNAVARFAELREILQLPPRALSIPTALENWAELKANQPR